MSEAVVYLRISYGLGEIDDDLLDAMLEEARHWGDFDVTVTDIIPINEDD